MRIEELGPPYIGGRVCASDPFSDALRRAPLKQHRRQDYGHTHTLNKAYVCSPQRIFRYTLLKVSRILNNNSTIFDI